MYQLPNNKRTHTVVKVPCNEMDDPILIVDRITTCLETLPLFAYDIYAPHVQSVLCIDKADVLTPCTSELFGEPAGGEIGALDRFKVETIALAVAKYPQYGFSATVIKVGTGGVLAQHICANRCIERILFQIYRICFQARLYRLPEVSRGPLGCRDP